MIREHAVALHGAPRILQRLAAGNELASPFREQERRVALVEVPDRGGEPEGADGPDPADTKDELLVSAHLAAGRYEDVRDRLVELGVFGKVRVEQQDRHAADVATHTATDNSRPGSSTVTVSGRPDGPAPARAATASGRSRDIRLLPPSASIVWRK